MSARRAFVATLAVLTAAGAGAAEPPTAPILRIETGMHAAAVRRLVVDAARNRLITSGDDKAVRIWQLPEGRLANVLRFPLGDGHEGRIFALAVSPDGATIAAAGWTGWEWDRQGAIYLFDAESGEMQRRVSGLPETVGFLAFSPGGGHLAVGLQGKAGLRVLRTTDYAVVASDAEYGDKILGADFRRDGRLAVAALDGLLRIYDPQFKLIGRKRSSPGAKPLVVKFSPDGTRLAVSFHDVPTLAVYSAADLSFSYSPDTGSGGKQTRMADLAWSADGEYLYGCGDYAGDGDNPIYRWGKSGRGELVRIPAAGQRITDLQPLPRGGVAFAAEDPGIGIIDSNGIRSLWIGPELADFREAGDALRLSHDGAIVEFPSQAKGKRVARFSLHERSLGAPAKDASLRPALRDAAEFSVKDWKDGTQTAINGVRLALDDYEVARSYALSPDRQTLVLGSEWALRAYGRDAKEKWKTSAPGVVWNVAVTGDGQSVVASLGDGTLRWYRIEDGVEYLALFPHGAGEEWIAWTPQGYYVSSNYGDNFVGWHLNRGKERAAEFFRAVQFERILYRPDVVEERFRNRGREAGLASRRAAEQFDVRQLAAIAPPRIRILDLAPAQPRDGAARAKLRFAVERNSIAMQDYGVFVNNMPLTPASRRRLAGKEASSFSREFEFDVTGRDNLIRIEVGNGASVGLVEKFYALPGAAASRVRRGDLYLLAVGVNQFTKLSGANLAYAARDAEEVEKFFRTQGGPGRYYRAVHTRLITDDTEVKPERARILEALAFIEAAGPRDTVVVFLASHGISDATGAYYFVPRDASTEDVNTVLRGADRPVTSLVAWTSFFDSLRRVAGRRVLIVDTCQAKNIEGRLDLHSLAKRSASSLFNLVVASKGNEESQEYPPAKHGLFTYALLDGLKGASDADRDGFITLQEAFRYTLPMVERLRNRIGPQSPQIMAPEPLGSIVLARVGGGAAAAAPPPVENAGCGVRTLLIGKRDPRCAQ